MADYGLRVSQDGFDVLTSSDLNMIFTPRRRPVKVMASASFSILLGAGLLDNQAVFSFGTLTTSSTYTFCYGETGNGIMVRGGGFNAITDFIGINSSVSYFFNTDGTYVSTVNVFAQRTTSSSSYPGAITVHGKVYLVLN